MTACSQFMVEHEFFSEYLKVNVTGIAQVNDVRKLYSDIYSVVTDRGINKVLLNCVQLELSYQSIELLDVMKDIHVLLRNLKLARVVSERGHKQMLIQQLAERNNLRVKNFTCLKDAITWLLDD